MLKGRDIIALASEDWGEWPSSSQHLMTVFARNNRVLWVDSVGMRAPRVCSKDARRIWSKLRKFRSGVKRINDHLSVFTPLVLPYHQYAACRRLNALLLKRRLNQLRRCMDISHPLWWISTPIMGELVSGWENDDSIYYKGDEYGAFEDNYARLIDATESYVMRHAQMSITISEPLHQKALDITPSALLIGHGVDVDLFGRAADPDTPLADEVANIPHPIVGFCGLVREWVDVDMIRELARKRPDWSFVIVGGNHVPEGWDASLPNIHLLGSKPYYQLPSYLKAFDVGLIPFRINELTLASNPLKLQEYLAAGLPVVTSDLPAVHDYEEYVRIAADADDYECQIEACLCNERPEMVEARLRRVAGESWEALADKISNAWECFTASGRPPHPNHSARVPQ